MVLADEEVRIIRTVRQLVAGAHYAGSLKFAQREFTYEVKFTPKIPNLLTLAEFENESDMRKCVCIDVKKNDEDIKLSLEEYLFFLMLLSELVMDIYNDFGLVAHDGCAPSKADMGLLNLTSEQCKMLQAQKFGCIF